MFYIEELHIRTLAFDSIQVLYIHTGITYVGRYVCPFVLYMVDVCMSFHVCLCVCCTCISGPLNTACVLRLEGLVKRLRDRMKW